MLQLLVPVACALARAALVAGEPRRLTITNGCPLETVWIAHEAAADVGPDPQNVEIRSGESHDFSTPNGLMATRYWPKMGCDANGGNCGLGGSGGPNEACVKQTPDGADYSTCAPPIDTKFEASFGTEGEPCNPAAPGGTEMAGCDYVDVSLVDGFTLPFRLEVEGKCEAKDQVVEEIDCSGLKFDECPKEEELTAGGFTVDLRAINPKTGKVAGCYAPCQKLMDEKWNNTVSEGRQRGDDVVAPYCCPTPPESPEACRAGPITQTKFLKTVHAKCPGVYGYAYDDGMGLMRCESSSRYKLTLYCPQALPPDVQKEQEEKERKEKERKAREKKEKAEKEKRDKERKEEERKEKERKEQEKKEEEKQQEKKKRNEVKEKELAQRKEKERKERERKEKEQKQKELKEKQQKAKEQKEREQKDKEQHEREHAEWEKQETERKKRKEEAAKRDAANKRKAPSLNDQPRINGTRSTEAEEPIFEAYGGFCCFAADDRSNFCATCLPPAKAESTSYCAKSAKNCETCGGRGRWCVENVKLDNTMYMKKAEVLDAELPERASVWTRFAWAAVAVAAAFTALVAIGGSFAWLRRQRPYSRNSDLEYLCARSRGAF